MLLTELFEQVEVSIVVPVDVKGQGTYVLPSVSVG